MTIFKTLIIHRHQALRQSKLVFNSLRLQSVFSIAIESNHTLQTDENKQEKIKKKPLHQMFAEAVGVRSKLGMSDNENDDERYIIKNLKKLEKEISRLKEVKADERIDHSEESVSDEKALSSRSLSGLFSGNSRKRDQRKPRSLSGLFSGENVKRDRRLKKDAELEAAAAPVMLKKLSTEMLMFVEELHKGGYFYDANFLPGNVFDASYFEDSYSRDYIKFAADRFSKDHQEIAKWLSGSQVKAVALYGCPNLMKNSIFAAKRLRTFFRIQEDTVCSRCVLRDSCKFVNQSVWNGDNKNLKLDDTLRLLIFYALEDVHQKLTLPDHFKTTVNLILRDVMNLSKTTS